jgi:deoxyribodipyrimidine photo-lyase
MTKKIIFWFRQDLRIYDNPGLYEACKNGAVLAIYILEDEKEDLKIGGASRWWLHNSLLKLNSRLEGKLNIYKGNSKEIILKLVKEYNVDGIYWNRCYEPFRIKNDSQVKLALKEKNIDCKSFNASLLWEPWEVLKDDGTTYKVFTPFYKYGCLKSKLPRDPLPAPSKINLIKDNKIAVKVEDLQLLPKIKWYLGLESYWMVGEEGAQERFKHFLNNGLSNYKEGRDFPSQENVSHLSPHLHFGEISPHQLWFTVQMQSLKSNVLSKDIDLFLTELGWREFSYYLLYHFPQLPKSNFKPNFNNFAWEDNKEDLQAWQKGLTGYPIIDAGMRQMWQIGYMHNRVRMIVSSFLVKNLLLHWKNGEKWFWDCLVDADLANNSASWQWIAGTGADSAPYFRIFNPITQAKKFDPEGKYIKEFVLELRNLPLPYLFKPWEAPPLVLQNAGVVLGKNYPRPIIDLNFSRQRALATFSALKRSL